MKTKKYFLLAFIALLTLFAFVGCSNQNTILDDVLKMGNEIDSTTQLYAEKNIAEEDGGLSALALNYSTSSVITLSNDDETNDLQIFNQLRLELISLHDQLVDARVSIRSTFGSIRNSVNNLKELDYIVLEGDKAIIQDKIDLLKTFKEDLIATSGTVVLV